MRGVYQSTVSEHKAGTQFARLDDAIFDYAYAATLIGSQIQIKFVSFNIYGGGGQSLADVPAYYYTVTGAAYTSPLENVQNFSRNFTGYQSSSTSQLSWDFIKDFRQVDYEVRQGSTWQDGQLLYRTYVNHGPILGDATYWVAAHFKVPNGGPDLYSPVPAQLTITGSQITQNVVESYDQAALSWPGAFDNTVISSLGLQLGGAGNILDDPDYINTLDIIYYGGVAASGTYTLPAGETVTLAEPAYCQVIIKMGAVIGFSLYSTNILNLPNFLTALNILGWQLAGNVSATPQINLSQDGTTFAGWQNWVPGTYLAKAIKARVVLATTDPNVYAVLSNFVFEVDVPSMVQSASNISLSAAGQTITFAKQFNGGPFGAADPNVQITLLNAVYGDTILLSAVTTSDFFVQISNGGTGVARTINYLAQGY